MKNRFTLSMLLIIGGIVFTAVSCQKIFPGEPEEHELLDGPLEDLSYEEGSRFFRGDQTFNDKIFTAETGLGPIFVVAVTQEMEKDIRFLP